ncbi:MAG TPA: exodeoxyribonuclease V subunit alpha [Balneolaceae bacterium]|nr:exodeoxyribonuclease V subunit alpha [Balneolaceae bacterium]
MKKLSKLNEQNIIHDIDIALCRFIEEQESRVADSVLLAAAMASYLYRQGDVCLLLKRYADKKVFGENNDSAGILAPDLKSWQKDLLQSEVVGKPGDFKPLIMDFAGRVYLQKLWKHEDVLSQQLLHRSQQAVTSIDMDLLKDGMVRLFENDADTIDWQQVAAANTIKQKLSIISGGPGTGKTSTVVRILALLLEQAQSNAREIRIALTAPTGKAAARLKDSILLAKSGLNVDPGIRETIPEQTMTLHQLLGARWHTSSFRYDAENPVPYDVVIVDEASMVDQALMSKLMQALLEDSRLILLGDKDQLASVEAGSVLGDICDVVKNHYSSQTASWLKQLSLSVPDAFITDDSKSLTDNITLLTKSYRFGTDSGIGLLAKCINRGDGDGALEILKSPDFGDVRFAAVNEQSKLEEMLKESSAGYMQKVRQSSSTEEALAVYDHFRVLSAHRRGPWGVESLNRLIEHILQREGLISKYESWYVGKPVIINTNDYTLGLHNGDTGICLRDENEEFRVFFRNENKIRSILPARLPDYRTAYALTVHKSQGSEFEKVFLILPDSPSKIVTRELLYTAVTRARKQIDIFGREMVFKDGILKKLERFSGLRDRLWGR